MLSNMSSADMSEDGPTETGSELAEYGTAVQEAIQMTDPSEVLLLPGEHGQYTHRRASDEHVPTR